jgi:hypothetical protein
MPNSVEVNDAVDKFVMSKGHAHVIQLNILTGPRLPAICKVVDWFCESLGPYRAMIHHIQVVIVRCGEYMGGSWTVPELDLEHFDPLIHFISGFLQVVPHYAQITWGGSDHHCFNLRKQYFRKALPAAQSAFETEEQGIKEFSEAIDGRVLKSIAKHHAQLQGQKLEAQPEAAAAAAALPESNGQQVICEDPFEALHNARVSQLWRPQADPMTATYAQQVSQPVQPGLYSQPDPNDPYFKQLKEVDGLRQKEWVHPSYDMAGATGYGEQTFMRTQGDAFPPQQMPAHTGYGQDMGGVSARGFYGDNNGGFGPGYATDEYPRGYGKKKNKKYKGGRGGYHNDLQDDAYLSRGSFQAGPGSWPNQQNGSDGYGPARPNGADPYPYVQKYEKPSDYNNNGYYHNGFQSDGYGSGRGKKNNRNGERLQLKSDSRRGQAPQYDVVPFHRRPQMETQESYDDIPILSSRPSRQSMYHEASNEFDTRTRQHANSFASDRTVKAGPNYAQRAGYDVNAGMPYEQRVGFNENDGGYAGIDPSTFRGQKAVFVGPDGVYGETKPLEW